MRTEGNADWQPAELERLANEHLFAREYERALFYSFLSAENQSHDWAVIRLAAASAGLIGSAEAARVLTRYNSQDRRANYQYALAHHQLAAGDKEAALASFNHAGSDGRIEGMYLFTEAKLRLECGQEQLARSKILARLDDLARTPWAFGATIQLFAAQDGFDEFTELLITEALRRDLNLDQSHWEDIAFQEARINGSASQQIQARLEPVARQRAREFADYVIHNRVNACVAEATSWVNSPKFLSLNLLRDLIASSVQNGMPFSFLRLGDGEGRFVGNISDYPAIQAAAAKKANRVWFWNSRAQPGQDFFARLAAAYQESDVVGINPPYRIAKEARNSALGYVGVTNGNKFGFDVCAGAGRYVTYNWSNVLLDKAGFFKDLVGMVPVINVIGPHEGIVDVLQAWSPRTNVRLIRIPSEGHQLVIDRSLKEPHFPDVFDRTCHTIKNFSGELFLVAGGVFGKIYCAEVKRAGGIALDVGSLVDLWLGLKTR